MAIQKLHIKEFLEKSHDALILDVRSPSEYRHAYMPGATSFPLFSDEERKIVGTAYKQESREKAIKLGLDFFGPKMSRMVEEVENLISEKNSKPVFVYCWRGGMRSAGIAWLLDLYGFKVYTLVGGYKSFRNFTLSAFRESYTFQVLGGYTGSGKTELLHELRRQGKAVIDLEGIASHKGSAFGNIGMPAQPGQEMFENILAIELMKKQGKPIWLEDESQRIGLVNLPGDLWKQMRVSPLYFLDIPFEERLNHIVLEYGSLDPERLANAISRIKEKLGGLNFKNAMKFLEEKNIEECFRILLAYYDRFYFKSLHNRTGLESLLHTIETKSISLENANLLIHYSPSLQKEV